MSGPLGRAVAAVAAWIAGATVSVAVALVAQSMIGDRIGANTVYPVTADQYRPPEPPVTSSPVEPELPRPSMSSRQPSTTADPVPARGDERAARADRVINSSAGALLARCVSEGAYLVSWSPQPGYRAEGVRRGPGEEVRIVFASGSNAVPLVIHCVDGVPVLRQPPLPSDPPSRRPQPGEPPPGQELDGRQPAPCPGVRSGTGCR